MFFELLPHSLWEHLVQERVGFLFFFIEFFGLVDQGDGVVLDVVGQRAYSFDQEGAHDDHYEDDDAAHHHAWQHKKWDLGQK